jgi:hypothetical protein
MKLRVLRSRPSCTAIALVYIAVANRRLKLNSQHGPCPRLIKQQKPKALVVVMDGLQVQYQRSPQVCKSRSEPEHWNCNHSAGDHMREAIKAVNGTGKAPRRGQRNQCLHSAMTYDLASFE